MRKDGHKVSLE
jgi:hypothetical protein